DRAEIIGASGLGGAIEIPVGPLDQTGERVGATRAGEAHECRVISAVGIHAEYRALSELAALVRRSIEFPVRGLKQRAVGIGRNRAEGSQNLIGLSAGGRRDERGSQAEEKGQSRFRS